MRERYFAAAAPKSCGREEFGAGFAERLIWMCREAGGTDADCVATATALTAESVVGAYRGFVVHILRGGLEPMSQIELRHLVPWKTEIFVAGGGAKNGTLMAMLREGFEEMGVQGAGDGGAGGPGAGQGGDGVRAAGVADVEWAGGECSCGDGSEEGGGAGEGYVRMRYAAGWRRAVRCANAHLERPEAGAKMGHPFCGTTSQVSESRPGAPGFVAG